MQKRENFSLFLCILPIDFWRGAHECEAANFNYTTSHAICQEFLRKNFAQIFFPKIMIFCATFFTFPIDI